MTAGLSTAWRRRAWRAALALLLAVAPAAGAWAQQGAEAPRTEVDRAQLERRLAAVATLLESSSAARQVEASGDPRALEKRARAREIYAQALQAYKSGELLKASQLLPEASVQMFEAVRLSAPDQVSGPKLRADYAARLDSVKSLLAAYRRISAEKPGAGGGAETARAMEKLMTEAERLAAAGEYAQARAPLDQAYLVAKAAISSMRSGDTLVRSLTFANREEEYHYEIDRNDTHRMLIHMLLEEKRKAAGMERMVGEFLERAAGLRAQAEAAFARGDPAGAIRLLEESTRELVRAIRGAGVYIPG